MTEKNPLKLDVVSVRIKKDTSLKSLTPICSPEDAVKLMGKYLSELDREVLCIINLKTDGTPISCHFSSVGSINESMVHPREIFKTSILSNAATIIMMHNHPSGDVIPSRHDTMATDRIARAGRLMGIPLTDHVIVGGGNEKFFSFRKMDLIDLDTIDLESDYRAIKMDPVGKCAARDVR